MSPKTKEHLEKLAHLIEGGELLYTPHAASSCSPTTVNLRDASLAGIISNPDRYTIIKEPRKFFMEETAADCYGTQQLYAHPNHVPKGNKGARVIKLIQDTNWKPEDRE